MKQLSITVSVPGGPISTYRFDEPVVRIGRSVDCHLSICHETVPRDLCRAWLEKDGTVRVEERPNLSNPLMCGGRLVSGGLSGAAIDLSVGPVRIRVEPSRISRDRGHEIAKSRKNLLLAGGAILSALLFCLAVFGKPKTPESLSMPSLPASPLPQAGDDLCDSRLSCREKGKMLATRAYELAHRAGAGAAERVKAASLLARASRLLVIGADPLAREVESSAKEMEREVTSSYRRHVLALRLAVERKDRAAARSVSKKVKEYLRNSNDRAGDQLDRLIGAKEEE